MIDVLTWLRAQDPTPALPLLRRALAVLIALLAGALAVLLLARPPHGEMARLLYDARAQGSFLVSAHKLRVNWPATVTPAAAANSAPSRH